MSLSLSLSLSLSASLSLSLYTLHHFSLDETHSFLHLSHLTSARLVHSPLSLGFWRRLTHTHTLFLATAGELGV